MQIHFGVMRNPCTPMFERLGPDSGFDIIGGRSSVTELARMLDLLLSKMRFRARSYIR